VPDEPVDPMDLAIDELAADGIKVSIDDRVLRLDNPVMGSPHLAALQALGAAARVPGPIGAAAHGPAGVAAAVWHAPELHIARWTGTSRWVAAYRFAARARPDAYLRDDAGIPSRLNRGNWYGEVPDEVSEAFFSVGLLLDEPPFPVPAPPPRPAAPAPEPSRRRSAAPRPPAAPRAPRKKAAPRPVKAAPVTRVCPGCNLSKHPSQFVADSDLCVDCR
jgi:hypothetical protein